MTCAVSESAASQPAAHAGRPARAPMPRMPSSTTSASPRPLGSVVSTTPAASAAARAPSWTVSWCTATAFQPASARRATAYSASAPLLPAPTSAATASPPLSSSRAAATPARPSTARAISSPSSSVAISARSAAYTASVDQASITAGPFGDDDGRRDAGVVGQGQVQRGDAERVDPGPHRAAHLEVRAAVGAAVHLGVVPVHARGAPSALATASLAANRAASEFSGRSRSPW